MNTDLAPADRSVNSDQDAHLNQQSGRPRRIQPVNPSEPRQRRSRLSHTRPSWATHENTYPGLVVEGSDSAVDQGDRAIEDSI